VMNLRVGFIGAGRVNFGWSGDPWDHARRLEILSETIPLEVVGIFDLNSELSKKVLQDRLEPSRNPSSRKIWLNTKLFTSLEQMIKEAQPQVVWIGIPPAAHGSIEFQCAGAGIHMFIEKPISCISPDLVDSIQQKLSQSKSIVSVGYMLRYSKVVDYVMNFLKENNLKPVSILARYNTAYPSIGSKMWWDIRSSGGPIIEQATHFYDLMRYFGGEINHSTISSNYVLPTENAGTLSKVPPGVEDNVPDQYRIMRAIHTTWKFTDGAIGVLSHGALTHGQKYFTQFEIWCDGYRILIHDPYTSDCYVEINGKRVNFADDDMYLSEDRIFLQAILTGDKSSIRSPYSDAIKTYKATWKVTELAYHKSKL